MKTIMKFFKKFKEKLKKLNELSKKFYVCPNCSKRVSFFYIEKNYILITTNTKTNCTYKTVECPNCHYLLGVRQPKERITE